MTPVIARKRSSRLPMNLTSATIVVLLTCLLLVVGCTEDPTAPALTDILSDQTNTRPIPEDEVVREDELKLLIESHGQGQGLAYFRMPGSFDFKNIPQDPKNVINGAKVTYGMYLFMDPGLAVNNVRAEGFETYSCGSCHPAQASFYANLPQGIGEGGSGFGVAGEGRVVLPAYDSSPDAPDTPPIRVPTAINGAYQEAVMWDGKLGGVGVNIGTEGQWTPGTALAANSLGMHGLETQAFVGLSEHRMKDIGSSQIVSNPLYILFSGNAFPSAPNPLSRLSAGKAIAAYERTILTNEAPFQRWLRGEKHALTPQQVRGAAVFFDKGNCVACHTGPALNSMTFHALGMFDLDNSWDIAKVELAPHGGTVPDHVRKGRGGFTGQPADDYKFKTPQLYNLKDSPFYGHGSSFSTIKQVIEYINLAVPENPIVPGTQLAAEFQPLRLSAREIDDLTAFVEDALYDPNMMRYLADFVPTNLCFPSNDTQSRSDICGLSAASLDLRRSPKAFLFRQAPQIASQ